MKIKSFFSKISNKADNKKETFLALEINTETIKAAVWSVVDGQVEVLRLGSIEEWENEEQILKSADAAINSALEGITSDPRKVIFGLPEDWVEEETIIGSKKKILSLVCEKLDLKPVGFVVSLEALVTYLKQKQGTPPSAIFIRLAETEIIVSLVTLGKIKGSHRVGRSQDLALDIKEGLARFKNTETLPARFILFDGLSDFEDAKQQIISFDWQEKMPFLHFPKVESFERDFVMKAIAIAGGSEVAKSLGFQIMEPEKETLKENLKEYPLEPEIGKDSGHLPFEDQTEEEKIRKDDEEIVKKDEDLLEEEKTILKSETKELSLEENSLDEEEKTFESKDDFVAGDLGFVKNEDIKDQTETPRFKVSSVEEYKKETGGRIREENQESEEDFHSHQPSRKKNFFSFFSFLGKFPKLIGFLFKKKLLALLIPVFGLLILISLVYFYLLRAQITLYFGSNDIEKDVTVLLDTEASSLDIEKKIIPAEELVVEVDGQSEIETTGEKTIGEKATGKVTVYNKTGTEKTLDSGTVLVGGDNLKFILDEEMTVASSSSQETSEGEEITWGKTEAKISAASVGEESNLQAGSNLSFKDYSSSSFSAKTEDGLEGGSSETVRVVTADDREKLLADFTVELQEKGKEKLKEKISDGKIILDKILETEVVDKEYDKKTDQQADKLNLKLKLSLLGVSFKNSDLQMLVQQELKDSIADGFGISGNEAGTEILGAEQKGNEVIVDLVAKASLTPVLETEEIQKNLAGKNNESARAYLFTLPDLQKAKIDIYPSFLGSLKILPFRAQNIKIETKME